ncbi:hypothetical protein [Sinosporangium siamense]|uniref:Uncharacterized protein n=1 Tax=Sinosporangium siamense TaxID=1367973 RepID=A0A919V6M5_9ACTN|nr:hypothetical protein [Sinosporangium siamense]GII91157.1 hypothetical protein Ssi02_13880 [Sinosporangium siamense]
MSARRSTSARLASALSAVVLAVRVRGILAADRCAGRDADSALRGWSADFANWCLRPACPVCWGRLWR